MTHPDTSGTQRKLVVPWQEGESHVDVLGRVPQRDDGGKWKVQRLLPDPTDSETYFWIVLEPSSTSGTQEGRDA